MTTKSNSINNKARFYPNIICRSTKKLILSDSTSKKVQAKYLSSITAIHCYPSAEVHDLSNFSKQYSGFHMIENLVIQVGYNNTDSGNSSFETASN